jgi:hypothetical protein
MQGAQSNLSALVSAARAQSALNLSNASIVIWGDKDDPATYLRRAAVMVNVKPVGSPTAFWVRKGDVVELPSGIFFVPPNAGGSLPAKFETVTDWTGLTKTEANVGTPVSLDVRLNESAGASDAENVTLKAYVSIGFNSYGQISNGTVNTMVVATGDLQPPADGVLFKNADSVRGLIVSTYGIPTLVNEKLGFK